jgi:adenylate cyclase
VRPGQDAEAPGEAEDALAAVRTALMLRAALWCFNRGRGGEAEPVLKTGCGINSGTVVAGQIGTEDRLEYTVIGDAVRLADYTESLSKFYGAEILITEHTWRLTGSSLVTEELPAITEKNGNTRLFAVINLKDPEEIGRFFTELEGVPQIDRAAAGQFVGTGGPRTLEELRSRLGMEAPDLIKAAVHEKKFKVRQK